MYSECMKFTLPLSTASTEQLWKAHVYLLSAFLLNIAVNILSLYGELPGSVSYMLSWMAVITSICVVAAMYLAERRCGFGIITAIAMIVIGFFLPIFALALVIGLEIRLMILLKQRGYRVGFFGMTQRS